jgi:hypothetical protein
VALVVGGMLALTACSSSSRSGTSGQHASSSTPATPSTLSSTSPPAFTSSVAPAPPTPTSPSEQATAQVLAFVPTYYAALDRLGASSTASLNALDGYAVDAENTLEKTVMAEHRSNGWVSVGTTTLVATSVTSVDLSSTASAQPTVKVTACIDVSGVREVDLATGKSVTVASRPNYFIEQLTVVNIAYPQATGWRVSSAPNQGATSCAGV